MSSPLSIKPAKPSTCSCFGKPKAKKTTASKAAQKALDGPPFAQPQDISAHLARGGLTPQTYKHIRTPTRHPDHPKE